MNGIHLTAFGYSLVAELFGGSPIVDQSRHMVIDIENQTVEGGALGNFVNLGQNDHAYTDALSIAGFRYSVVVYSRIA